MIHDFVLILLTSSIIPTQRVHLETWVNEDILPIMCEYVRGYGFVSHRFLVLVLLKLPCRLAEASLRELDVSNRSAREALLIQRLEGSSVRIMS